MNMPYDRNIHILYSYVNLYLHVDNTIFQFNDAVKLLIFMYDSEHFSMLKILSFHFKNPICYSIMNFCTFK